MENDSCMQNSHANTNISSYKKHLSSKVDENKIIGDPLTEGKYNDVFEIDEAGKKLSIKQKLILRKKRKCYLRGKIKKSRDNAVNKNRVTIKTESGENLFWKNENKRADFYSSLPIWDILVDSSDVSEGSCNVDATSFSARRLSSMIYNLDQINDKFKKFVDAVCEETNNATESKDGVLPNEKYIHLTKAMSIILNKPNAKLSITNPEKINNIFEASSVIVESILKYFSMNNSILFKKKQAYDNIAENAADDIDLETGGCIKNEIMLDAIESSQERLNIYENVPNFEECEYFPEVDTCSNVVYNSNENITDVNSTEVELHGISTKDIFKPEQIKRSPGGRFRRQGYYPDYIISEEIYNSIISKGSPYTCTLCKKVYKLRCSFEHHLADGIGRKCRGMPIPTPKYKVKNGRYFCTEPGCDDEDIKKGGKTVDTIWYHYQKKHLSDDMEKPFKCDKCENAFLLQSLLTNHINTKHLQDKWKIEHFCDICGKVLYGGKNRLKQHMVVHQKEKDYKCHECGVEFRQPQSLHRHLQHQHNPSYKIKLHFCETCGKGYKTRSALKEHVQTHSGKPAFLCRICGKGLKNDSCYRRHMVCVHGVKYTCNICNKEYSAILGLQQHQRDVHGILS